MADTQYYVRDAVIEYTQAQTAPISPAIEGRLEFPPVVATPVIAPEPSVEGSPVVASAAFTDPIPDDSPYTCTVNYGDGSGDLAGVVTDLVCTGPEHVYARYGVYYVTVKVADDNGWVGQSMVQHSVQFKFTGFLSPLVNPPAMNDWPLDAQIPMNFMLNGYKGMNFLAGGRPLYAFANCRTGKVISSYNPLPVPYSLAYKPETDIYSLVFAPPKAWANSCVLVTLKFVDGTNHPALFRFGR